MLDNVEQRFETDIHISLYKLSAGNQERLRIKFHNIRIIVLCVRSAARNWKQESLLRCFT